MTKPRTALVTGGTGAIGTEICRQLLAAGVKIRPVGEALEHSLRNWKPE